MDKGLASNDQQWSLQGLSFFDQRSRALVLEYGSFGSYIKVLQEIANSNKYRKGVAELLWDDTCFGSVETLQTNSIRVFDTDTDFLWDPKEFSVTPKLITRHGFCSALRMLAKRERHKVVEFVVEDQAYTDGVNIDLFDNTGYTYADVISLIQRPGISRL
ncbi:hypothetical protein FOIG_13025 [Fusarium odoratissimum NRRL 54006]|uniref:Uncharacterized protein n=2 Tax=Fusarium oxysporum species complex TaxID=171631 RepID=X0IYS3_FUSO5|nr:uncharacterized protein FOIG_13025 [Fusarium odoratissimum NRRL 54006]EXL94118.1 hypothetical protein FOIG_13025 [Fusarium odoratissimum NRRL 54006]TXC06477.1 hypothetical protein FocTR4_00010387 [Fusarium oxysporum f. sp. cubense]